MTQNGISYVLNASNSCPKPDFICESHFMRIPINDNYCEKLLPWLDKSIEFIGEAGCCPLPGGQAEAEGRPGTVATLLRQGGSLRNSWDCCYRVGVVATKVGGPSHLSLHLVPMLLLPDKAKLSSCQVIVHCLAGISRSATIAIAYIMKTMGMSSDDAYRYCSPPGPAA